MHTDPILALRWAVDQLSPADLLDSADALHSLREFLARGTGQQRRQIFAESSPRRKISRGRLASPSCHCTSVQATRKRKRLLNCARSHTDSPGPCSFGTTTSCSNHDSSWGTPESTSSLPSHLTAASTSSEDPTASRCSPTGDTAPSPSATGETPPPDGSSPHDHVLSAARQFFESQLGEARRSRTPSLVRALQGFLESETPAADFASAVWGTTGAVFGEEATGSGRLVNTTTTTTTTRLQRLYEGHRRVKEGRDKFACAARFCHIYLEHDLEQLLANAGHQLELSQGCGRVTAGLRLQAASVGTTVDAVKAERKAGRNYARLLVLGGPGFVLRVGCGVSTVWERKLSKSDMQLVLDFLRTRVPHVFADIEACNAIAARALLNGLLAYGWTRAEILQTRSTLFDVLRLHIDVSSHVDQSDNSIPSSTPATAHSSPTTDASSELSVPSTATSITTLFPDCPIGTDTPRTSFPALDAAYDMMLDRAAPDALESLASCDAASEPQDPAFPFCAEDSLLPPSDSVYNTDLPDQEAEMLLQNLDAMFSYDQW